MSLRLSNIFILAGGDPPTSPVNRKLTANGKSFFLNGKKFFPIGISSFSLAKLYFNGHDIDPILNQMISLGFTTPRIFLMWSAINFTPKHYVDYFTHLDKFARYLEQSGLIPEYVIFTDAQILMPSEIEQKTFLHRCASILHDRCCFKELVNEYPKNGIQPDHFSRPDGTMWSSGSNVDSLGPAEPLWGYATYHSRRDYKWLENSAKFAVEFNGDLPRFVNEPIGFDKNDPRYRHNVRDAFYLGLMLGMTNSGGTYHCTLGKESKVLSGFQLEAAQEFVRGVRIINKD